MISSFLIYCQFCLGCSGELFFCHQVRDSEGKSEKLIQYSYHNCSFENYDLIYLHVDGSAQNEVVSLV